MTEKLQNKMSHQRLENARLAAKADEGSETDVESGDANDHNESDSFLREFKGDDVPYDEQQTENKRVRDVRSIILSVFFVLAPWILSLVLLAALISERRQGKSLCNEDDKTQYTLAQDHIEYRTELMYDGVDNRNPASEYQGWPNDEKDKLWDQFDGRRHDTFVRMPKHDN